MHAHRFSCVTLTLAAASSCVKFAGPSSSPGARPATADQVFLPVQREAVVQRDVSLVPRFPMQLAGAGPGCELPAPIARCPRAAVQAAAPVAPKGLRQPRSEEHTSELQSRE